MFLDRLSEFLSRRRGLPTITAVALVILNFVVQFIPAASWLAETNLLLHLGVITGFLGILLSAALG